MSAEPSPSGAGPRTPAGGRPAARVGNDVLDLGWRRMSGRAADARFVERVLAPSERRALDEAPDADFALWSMWAAKEVAYKVVSKVLGEAPPFVHASFVVRWRKGVGDGDVAAGAVEYGGHRVRVRARREGKVLHAIGTDVAAWEHVASGVEPLDRIAGARSLEELRAELTDRERPAAYSRASAAIRLTARRALAGRLGVAEGRVEIVCAPGAPGRQPPMAFLDGAPAPLDVSLSHHREWLGWALWTGGAQGDSFGAATDPPIPST